MQTSDAFLDAPKAALSLQSFSQIPLSAIWSNSSVRYIFFRNRYKKVAKVINHSYIIYLDRYELPTNCAFDICLLNQGLFHLPGPRSDTNLLLPLIVSCSCLQLMFACKPGSNYTILKGVRLYGSYIYVSKWYMKGGRLNNQ